MKMISRPGFVLIASVVLVLSSSALAAAQAIRTTRSSQIRGTMNVTQAKGTFDVKMAPLAADPFATEAGLARMSIDKTFHGDIEGTSKGEMTATSIEGGSGAYVALEKVTGTLNGRKGTFLFVHRGLMTKGTPDLSVTVVPDSGTGELVGLTGTFDIKIEGGKHSYEFNYSLPAKP